MTKKELLKALEPFGDDIGVIVMDEFNTWDNIIEVTGNTSEIRIIFGGGSPFSDEQ